MISESKNGLKSGECEARLNATFLMMQRRAEENNNLLLEKHTADV